MSSGDVKKTRSLPFKSSTCRKTQVGLSAIDSMDEKRSSSSMRLQNVDEVLCQRLESISSSNASHWDFKGIRRSEFEQSPYQYPAMMVPALQREIVSSILDLQPEVETIADPFVGSGTVLCEAMLSGRNFIGQDVNPLAILTSIMRSEALEYNLISDSIKKISSNVRNDRKREYAVTFAGQMKWFNRGANIGLSRLRRVILDVDEKFVRLFFWVALAETIRLTSNSRTSTYKLHVKPPENRTAQSADVIETFMQICDRNLAIATNFSRSLMERGFICNDRFIRSISILLADSTNGFANNSPVDMLMSSPPYGDNRTTVPYGQASWLPLQWIDGDDITSSSEIKGLIRTTAAIDGISIGGRVNNKKINAQRDELCDSSPHFKVTVDALKGEYVDGVSRLTSFIYDLKKVLDNSAKSCSKNSYAVWTLGHRRIRKVECPLTEIMVELSEPNKWTEVTRIQRQIPFKRMAQRNNISQTMKQETVLILRKMEADHE